MFFRTKLFLTLTVIGFLFCLMSSVSYAATYHVVQPNDTIWSISQIYGVNTSAVRELNNLQDDLIHPGQKLLICSDSSDNNVTLARNTKSDNNDLGCRIIEYAKTLIGVPYRSGGSSPAGFDCSGYTNYVYKQFNINLPRTSGGQYNCGKPVSANEAKPGDLVAFSSGSRINHVGIYIGSGNFIHSSSSRGITISSLNDSYWGPRFVGYSRVIASL